MISIAMCTYNGSRFLTEQLTSIANQTRLPDELIISDDNSTDHTLEIARDFARTAPFPVRVIDNLDRAGVIANFERAIASVTGDIVVLADQDDFWFPNKLAATERAFDDPDVGLVFSDAEIADDDLNPTGERLWQYVRLTPALRRRIENGIAIDVLWPGWTISGGTMAFRSALRELVLPIPQDLPILHDGWIAAVAGCVMRIRAIDEPLIKWRQHGAQQTGARPRPDTSNRWAARLRRVNTHAREMAITDRVAARVRSQRTFPVRPGATDSLQQRNLHAGIRATLSPRPVTRARHVFVELVNGRYHRFSNGLLSAAKDLVAGHRSPAAAATPSPIVPPSVRETLAPFIPPPGRMSVGDGDFLETGFKFLQLFKNAGGITPTSCVLEIGCGIGRMAIPLTQYLSADGSYDGFDIVGSGIQWCEDRITTAYPNFRFRLVDLFNTAYNPTGTLDANTSEFPYGAGQFDFVFLTSIFTHLLPETVAHYLAQIRRVLKHDGRCLMTVFLLNDDARRGIRRRLSFHVPAAHYGHYAVADERCPEAVVFYDEIYFKNLIAKHGFRLRQPIRYGSWCGRSPANEYQDVLIVESSVD